MTQATSSNDFVYRECKVMPLAVVGMAFRGPGDASNVDNLYKFLAEAREAWTPIPTSRWNKEAFYHPDIARKGASNVQGGHFFNQDLEKFDAPFFGMREEEAACLDPQQRMLLECCYEALENSGTPLDRAIGSDTSVFVGLFGADYPELLYRDPETIPMYQATNAGNSRAIISNRLSYFFNFKGPSVTVDTACSASLVAFHLACQSLWTGDASQAIVGGSSVLLNSDLLTSMSAMGFLSPEGRCYSFDERAQGYGRGEGVGCIMIKPLDKALQDGDNIRAIVRNTACNQDGKTPGITFPSRTAQEALIRRAYERAGLDPAETDCVEAHGTGTQAGDPIEAGAIGSVFGSSRLSTRPVTIGSIKSNIGHLEGASGVAGLIKAILMLENQVILPSRNFQKANSRIPMEDWNIRVATELTPWITDGPRRVSVNSFGYGGTNAHVILEDAATFFKDHSSSIESSLPAPSILDSHGHGNGHTNGKRTEEEEHKVEVIVNGSKPVSRRRLFKFSAFDQKAGKKQAEAMIQYLNRRQLDDDAALDNLAYTLYKRRTAFPWSSTLAAASATELAAALGDQDFRLSKARSETPAVAFVFTGQGAQWARMGVELLDEFPVYRKSIESSRDQLKNLGASWDLIDELRRETSESRINQAEFCQPICSAVQCALVDLFFSWNIVPIAVTGHSSGEIAAAYCMGAIDLEVAMTAAYYRGIVAASLEVAGKLPVKGAMMAVALSREEVQPLLKTMNSGQLCVACVNSPSNVTVSGDEAAIDELHGYLKMHHSSIFARKLKINVAYHSHHMKVIGDEYLACIPPIHAPEDRGIAFFSSVTASKVKASDLGPQYWVRNLLSEVQFLASLSQMCHEAFTGDGDRKVDVLVEIGPHSALAGPIKQILSADAELEKAKIVYVSPLSRGKHAVETVHDAVSRLTTEGVPVDISAVNQLSSSSTSSFRCLSDLPAYPWNHSKSFWAEGRISKAYRQRMFPRTDVLGVEDRNFNPLEPRWRNMIRLSEIPWVQHHRIQNNIVYPAGGFVAMAIEAARQRAMAAGADDEIEGFRLREVVIPQALVIPLKPGEVETAVTFRRYREGTRSTSDIWDEFSIHSVSQDNVWTEHCRGMISSVKPSPATELNGSSLRNGASAAKINTVVISVARCQKSLDVNRLYETLREAGLDYGPSFASITSGHTGTTGECVATLTIPDTAAVMPQKYEHACLVHPATIDGMLHPMLAVLAANTRGPFDPVVPVSIRDIYFSSKIPQDAGAKLKIYAANANDNAYGKSKNLESLITVTDDSDQPTDLYGWIEGLTCKPLARDHVVDSSTVTNRLAWNLAWGVDPDFVPAFTSAVYEAPLSERLQTFCRELGFKNSQMRILWVGQGVSNALRVILQALGLDSDSEHPLIAQCDICAPSQESQDHARALLEPLSSTVECKILDFGSDSLRECKTASYDLIVGEGLGLSRPGDGDLIQSMLPELRRLLRPNAKLLLVDAQASPVSPQGSDVENSDGSEEWKSRLLTAGLFNPGQASIDIAGSADDRYTSMTVSSASPPTGESTAPVVIVVESKDGKDDDLSSMLAAELEPYSPSVTVSTVQEAKVQGAICIILAELSRNLLDSPTSDQFSFCKDAFTQSAGTMWVTRGAYSDQPLSNLVSGLARTVRSENGTTIILTVDLDGENLLSPPETASLLTRLFAGRFGLGWSKLGEIDMEFREVNGNLLVPRVLEDDQVNEHIDAATTSAVLTEQPLCQTDRPLRMELGTPGMVSSIQWTDDDFIQPQVPDDCIEIAVKASGINFRDVMMALGQIGIDRLGGECSGVVMAVGKAVDGFSPGDRVAGLHLGSFASRAQPKASLMKRIPMEMSFTTAAALPVAYVTAYYSLIEIARLRARETILIHAATGGVGQAAIEVSQLIGADIFVTVGSKEKKQFVMDRYGIAADHIFSSRDGSFALGIMAMTNGRGVDVILNSVAGEAHRLTWNCIGAFGRFIELGKRDIFVNTRLEMQRFAKNVTFSTFDLVDLIRARPEASGYALGRVFELLETGCIRPPSPILPYSMSETPKALQLMQSGKHIGKLVSVVSPDDVVKAPPPKSTTQAPLRGDVSYLIVGGLGGLGRSIAAWMVQQGARNLVFANRSGGESDLARNAVEELISQGARVLVQACDVAEGKQVEALVTAVEKAGMPQIKGVIHSAMLLRDSMFDEMTLDQYQQGLRVKVQGTLALHAALPRDMDFFILLSSVSGVIGNASQGNYAAANTFLDAFAQYRNRMGLAAIAIDLGVITGVGHVADNRDLALAMQRQGFAGTDEQQLLALIHFAIIQSHRPLAKGQVVTGLGTWSETAVENLRRPMFSHFRRRNASSSAAGKDTGGDDDILYGLAKLSPEAGAERICDALRVKVAELCMLALDDVFPSKTLSQYGIDSLVAVEMRNWISRKFDHTIPILELLANNSLAKLSLKIMAKFRETENA